ncbi:MAG TPA: hypothetical protein VFV67_36530 [Actinophytocola sp.]|uniref:hypothetical protein n=1 Tax=Actinophytocola sp. TaxID=1872138 RepID=UPI002DB9CFFE|nr:hypothetical protein [Actinophytocola sp.]HEU5476164.1 hypothetical protein [Actinophytocola sp.]
MATEAALERARCWLRRQRLEIEPSPLVVGRLEARRRGARAEIVTELAGVIALLTWMFLVHGGDDPVTNQAWSIGIIGIVVVGMLVGFWWQRRVERPLLAGHPTRAAHPAAAGVERVLGRAHLRAAVAVYGGGLLLGTALAMFAPPGTARGLALVFLAGVTVLGALSGLALATTLRRPSLADDAESLLVDDALRTEDARRATLPYVLIVALMFAMDPTIGLGSPASMALLGYAVAGGACWYLAERNARCARKVEPAVR